MGGWFLIAMFARYPRNTFWSLRSAFRWSRSVSARAVSPYMGRKSKKATELSTASGVGVEIQVEKYFFQILSGWHHWGLLAM